ncbi:MAG: hypothetical protein KGJ13_11585 [Patescibacteria group bacterium]|nr:hypothetical protein [Patescibacteria group bacterium]
MSDIYKIDDKVKFIRGNFTFAGQIKNERRICGRHEWLIKLAWLSNMLWVQNSSIIGRVDEKEEYAP